MLYSKKLHQFKELTHGFTTRQDGDAQAWIANNSSKMKSFILPEQIHGDKISFVDESHTNKISSGVDGLLTSSTGIIIGVRTADCVPLLFYEPTQKIIGVVHAGWRGTLLRISQKMIKKIQDLKGQADNLIVTIGPHIGMCCYNVEKDRANLFKKEFIKNNEIVTYFHNSYHLDLGLTNYFQLIESGVKKDNIETLDFCTHCYQNHFYSYRRSQKDKSPFGEMLSFIGKLR
ncbi:MAG: peptidoglycan editing factor PgeF [Candidatus Gottesmanbacteria bacterium]